MKKLPVAVFLGHDDLDFTLGLKLGRSDDSLLPSQPPTLVAAAIFIAEKRKTVLLSLTDVLKRNFLKS